MIPVVLLITLMILTWGAAVYAVYAQPDEPSGSSQGRSEQDSYYDAA